MYTVHLIIWASGFSAEMAAVLSSVQPLPRFQHTFQFNPDFSASSAQTPDVVIFSPAADVSPCEVRQRAGEKAVCVCCTGQPEKLSSEELRSLDDVWPFPQGEALLHFYFLRLLQRLQAQKKSWFYRTCWQTTINMVPDLIWYKDIRGAHTEINDAFCSVVGKAKSDIRGRGHYYIWGLSEEEYQKGEFVCMETEQEVMESGKANVFDEQVLRQDKTLMQLKTYKAPIFDEDGTILGTVGVAHDVTQERAYEEKILQMARQDELTGLANRRYFYSYVNQYRRDQNLGLLYIDVDAFKEINDRCGHQAGDDLLVLIAQLMQSSFSDGFCVRFGGDEFLVLFLGLYSQHELEKRANVFLQDLGRESSHHMYCDTVQASIGIAFARSPQIPIDQLIYEADVALYWAKEHGKARYGTFSEQIAAEVSLLNKRQKGGTRE